MNLFNPLWGWEFDASKPGLHLGLLLLNPFRVSTPETSLFGVRFRETHRDIDHIGLKYFCAIWVNSTGVLVLNKK